MDNYDRLSVSIKIQVVNSTARTISRWMTMLINTARRIEHHGAPFIMSLFTGICKDPCLDAGAEI